MQIDLSRNHSSYIFWDANSKCHQIGLSSLFQPQDCQLLKEMGYLLTQAEKQVGISEKKAVKMRSGLDSHMKYFGFGCDSLMHSHLT